MIELQLKFLKAYIDMYSLQDKDIIDIIKECKDYLHDKETMKDFVIHYNIIIYKGLKDVMKDYISKGNTFFGACYDWNININPN